MSPYWKRSAAFTASPGVAKRARKPSPKSFSTCALGVDRTIDLNSRSWRASSLAYCSAPSRVFRSTEPTTSVNSSTIIEDCMPASIASGIVPIRIDASNAL